MVYTDYLLYVHQNTLFVDDATTDWAVALTCYISHSVKHRKMTAFDSSGSRNPLTNFDKTWHDDYVGDITPHDNFGRSGPTWTCAWLVTSLSFLSFFLSFLLTSLHARSHVLTDRNDLYAQTGRIDRHVSNVCKTCFFWLRQTCSSLAGHWVCKDVSSRLCHIACRLL